VYAVGLYLERSAISSLEKFSGTPAAKLAKQQPFFDAISAARPVKTLLLRFHRTVGAPAVVEVRTCISDS